VTSASRSYRLRAACSLAVLLAAAACERTLGPDEGRRARLTVTANLAGSPLSTLVLEVSGSDISPALLFNLTLVDGVASQTILVPAGSARLIIARAFDENGLETHRGTRTIDVRGGTENPPVVLNLVPLAGDVPVAAQIDEYRVVIAPPTLRLNVGESATLTATVLDRAGNVVDAGGALRWATNNPGVAGAGQTAEVVGLAPGAALVVATYKGGGGAASLVVNDGPSFDAVVRGIRPRGFGATPYALRSPAPDGRVWHVATTGDDQAAGDDAAPLRTINRAGQLAEAGDVVIIAPGTYAESVVVRNSGTLERPIVFQAAERGAVVLTGGRFTFQPAFWTGGPEPRGQWYIVVRGLVFRRYSDPLSTENAIAAVRATKGWVIEDNLFDDAGKTALEVRDSDVEITRSTFRHNYVNAIVTWAPKKDADGPSDPRYVPLTGLRLTDLVIHGNNTTPDPTLAELAEYVVKIWGTRGAIVDNVESYENFGPGLWFDTNNSDFTIRNSYFHHNRPVPGSSDEKGKGVFIEINWAPGLIEHNVFLDNEGAGLNLENSAGIEVRNNLFAGNAHCITLANGNRGETDTGEPLYPLRDLFIHGNQCSDWGGPGGVPTIWGTFTASPAAMGIRVDGNTYDPRRNAALAKWGSSGLLTTLAELRSRLGWETRGVIAPVARP
jgi:hypothetical protein